MSIHVQQDKATFGKPCVSPSFLSTDEAQGRRCAGEGSSGFTLIELMIVLLIVAILAAIAYPAYTGYLRSAQRADAQAALMNAAQRLERRYTAAGEYSAAQTTIASEQGYWTVKVDITDSGQSYFLTAQKTDKGVTDATCSGSMTLDPQGRREPDSCW
ncbi:type IV pilin [Salinisphaera orenii MK-B5]|uniref:Type IV pilin n=1 Tax=Salinisphaera orenii MK-B5 TaxID=856730 RepID=A0A423PXP6_9GAMM|nr:type IV pilin [Salinisphaera orenii MK-B5]